MSALKLMFIAALTLSLTACPDRFNDQQSKRAKETAKYEGTWVRAVDYCEYMQDGSAYGTNDYRCDDVRWEDNRSAAAFDDAWLIIAINREGGINSFSMYSAEQSNGNWGLGYITPEGFYVGYLTTMGNKRQADVIQVLLDAEFLTLFSNSGRFTNRVSFIRMNRTEARNFEAEYYSCAGNGYCKGKNNPTTKERRKAKRDNDNGRKDDGRLGKFDQEKYDECIADGGTPEDCARGNSRGNNGKTGRRDRDFDQEKYDECIADGGTPEDCDTTSKPDSGS